MAITAAGPMILDDAEVTIDAVDLSDHVESVELNITGDAVEVSAMGDAWRKFLRNRPGAEFTVNFLQDYYTAEVDKTLRTKAVSGAEFAVTLKPDKSTATGANNEEASFQAIITSYPWLGGDYNDKLTASVDFQVTGAVTWATS